MRFEEQRASERFAYEAPVIIEVDQTGESFDGSMYNYSHGGMYVELDNFLRPGSKVRISVERENAFSDKEYLQAKIIWCREITGAVVLYDYGAGVQYDPATNDPDWRKIFRVIEGGAS